MTDKKLGVNFKRFLFCGGILKNTIRFQGKIETVIPNLSSNELEKLSSLINHLGKY